MNGITEESKIEQMYEGHDKLVNELLSVFLRAFLDKEVSEIKEREERKGEKKEN